MRTPLDAFRAPPRSSPVTILGPILLVSILPAVCSASLASQIDQLSLDSEEVSRDAETYAKRDRLAPNQDTLDTMSRTDRKTHSHRNRTEPYSEDIKEREDGLKSHKIQNTLEDESNYNIRENYDKNNLTDFLSIHGLNEKNTIHNTPESHISNETNLLDITNISEALEDNSNETELSQPNAAFPEAAYSQENTTSEASHIANNASLGIATYLLNGDSLNGSQFPVKAFDNGSLHGSGLDNTFPLSGYIPPTLIYRAKYETSSRPPQPWGFVEGVRSTSARVVSILGLFEMSRGGIARPEGRSELAAARLAVRHVNRANLLPGYSLQLITNDTECDAGVGVDRFFHALYTERSRVVMLLGTACSDVTESLAKVVPYWNIVQVSFGSTSPALSDRAEFPLFYRTVAPDSSHNPARIAFIRKFGWDTVTAFSQNEEVYSLAVNELLTELEAANITCAAAITFAETDLSEQLRQLKELDTRIIIGSFSPEMLPKIFCEAYRLGMYGAEYAWIVSGGSLEVAHAPCAPQQLAAALDALVLVDAHSGIVGANTSLAGLTNEMFEEELKAMGANMSAYAPHTYDAVWAIALALRNAEAIWSAARDADHTEGTAIRDANNTGGSAAKDSDYTGGSTTKDANHTVASAARDTDHTGGSATRDANHMGGSVTRDANHPGGSATRDANHTGGSATRDANHMKGGGNSMQRALPYGLGYFDYSRKDMADEFLNQLGRLSFLGVSGPVSFDGPDRVGTSAFHQIQEGVPRTVALYSGGRAVACQACARARWGSGAPPIARRVLRVRVDAVWPPARLAGAALAAAGAALALAFLAFNLHYSKRRSIKLSSPRLNNMTLIGCVLVYASVALLGLDNATLPSYVPFSAMCTGRVYILSAGFSLAFGSMFAKTYRVHRIFISNRSGVCKTKLLQDTQLISLVCALLVVDGLVVTLWALTDPMERHLKNLTVEISATDRGVVYQPQLEVCKSRNTTGWLCALYAYKGLLLLVGVYMAWETRNVKISALNDSKYIGISVYSVVITSASVVVLGTIISERATLAYVTITSLILVSTTATLCLLFLPKIISIMDKSEDDPIIQSMGLKLECKTRRFVTDETQELHFRTEIQNKVYRREMAALDKEISRLERLLLETNTESSSSSTLSVHRKTESMEEAEEGRKMSLPERRTPSITGGLPLLLLSVLPPVIPRASWPSAAHLPRARVSFSSQPKLDQRRSQPAIDLYNLCVNRRENTGLLARLRNIFTAKSPSRKSSTMSIADPSGQGIAAALKMHVGMIANLVPGSNRNPMVVSCNTLDVPVPDFTLRRESFAKSGPIIRVFDEPGPSSDRIDTKKRTQKYIAEPETRVNFVLPQTHRPSAATPSSCERIRGSPRFPHRIAPTAGSLTTLEDRRKTSADVFCISVENLEHARRYSHQNFGEGVDGKEALESRWKSAEDATSGGLRTGT